MCQHLRLILLPLLKELNRRIITDIKPFSQLCLFRPINLSKLQLLLHLRGQSRPIRQQLSTIPIPRSNKCNSPSILLILHHHLLKIILIQNNHILVIISFILLVLPQCIQLQIMKIPIPFIIPYQTVLFLFPCCEILQRRIRINLKSPCQFRLSARFYLRYLHFPLQFRRQFLPIRRKFLTMSTPWCKEFYKHCFLIIHHHLIKIIIRQYYHIPILLIRKILFLFLLNYNFGLPLAFLRFLLFLLFG